MERPTQWQIFTGGLMNPGQTEFVFVLMNLLIVVLLSALAYLFAAELEPKRKKKFYTFFGFGIVFFLMINTFFLTANLADTEETIFFDSGANKKWYNENIEAFYGNLEWEQAEVIDILTLKKMVREGEYILWENQLPKSGFPETERDRKKKALINWWSEKEGAEEIYEVGLRVKNERGNLEEITVIGTIKLIDEEEQMVKYIETKQAVFDLAENQRFGEIQVEKIFIEFLSKK